jgi:hypothetical protein
VEQKLNRISSALQGSYDNAYAVGKVALPVALSSAVQIGMHDKRFSNIIGGTLLMGSGFSLISKADIPALVRGSFLTTETISQDTTSNKMMRLGMATVGLAVAGAGAYNVYSGFSELLRPAIDLKMNATLPIAQPMNSPNEDPLASCKQKLAEGKELYLSCPEAKKMWNEVEKEGPFTLDCMPQEGLFSRGATDSNARKIFLTEYRLKGEESSMKETLAFELMNLKNHKSFGVLNGKMCAMSGDEYAKQIELIEYNSYRSLMSLTKRCIKGGFWSSWPSTLAKEFMNSTEFLWRGEISGHTNSYRLHWQTQCAEEDLENFLKYLYVLYRDHGIELPPNYYDVFKAVDLAKRAL